MSAPARQPSKQPSRPEPETSAAMEGETKAQRHQRLLAFNTARERLQEHVADAELLLNNPDEFRTCISTAYALMDRQPQLCDEFGEKLQDLRSCFENIQIARAEAEQQAALRARKRTDVLEALQESARTCKEAEEEAARLLEERQAATREADARARALRQDLETSAAEEQEASRVLAELREQKAELEARIDEAEETLAEAKRRGERILEAAALAAGL